MEKIREVAVFCIGRAVMFGSLAITCVMVGFSFNPVSAFRAGAVLTLLMAAILIWKAYAAARQNPKSTEVWMYLDDKARPDNEHSRFVFAAVMRDVYARFGQASLAVACLFFAISMVFVMFGFKAHQPEISPYTAQATERAVPE
jgi:Ca2+/Na+ antiporter